MAKKDFRASGREDSQLDDRLSDYAAATRISAAAKSLYRRTGNWPIYAAATGSALAMATGASASIITSGIISGTYPSGISVNPGGPKTHVGLIPGLSVKLHALSTNAGSVVQLQVEANANIIFSQFSDAAKNFGFESPIAPGLPPGGGAGPTENIQAFFTGNRYGNFAAGQPGFIGLSFSTVHGNTDYGWMELEFRNNPAGIPFYLEALAFGIDTNPGQTPGTLLAGEINNGFIPEPGTLSLAILASGAAGVMALRRRRKQSASASPVL
jgi:hypothetical protein